METKIQDRRRLAVQGGIYGSIEIILLFWLGRMLGFTATSPESVLGRLIFPRDSILSESFGIVWFAGNGVLIALVYQAIFRARKRSSVAYGMMIGLVHAFLAIYAYEALWLLPVYLPDLGSNLRSSFEVRHEALVRGTWDAVWILITHTLYGGIVGAFDSRWSRRSHDKVGKHAPPESVHGLSPQGPSSVRGKVVSMRASRAFK